MATAPASRTTTRDGDGRSGFGTAVSRLSTETRPRLIMYAAATIATYSHA